MGRPVKKISEVDRLRSELSLAICLQDRPQSGPFRIQYTQVKAKRHRAKKCPHSKELLMDMYVNQGMIRKQIANHFGVGMGVVNGWFSGLGIKLPEEMYNNAVRGQCRSVVSNARSAQLKQQRNLAHNNTHLMDGYRRLYNPGHPSCTKDGYIPEHRHVIEAEIKRFLTDEEHVHHVNYDRVDNRLCNLMLVSAVDHGRFHKFMEYYGAYALGAVKENPGSFKFTTPAFWNGEWYDEISVDKFSEISGKNQKEKVLN